MKELGDAVLRLGKLALQFGRTNRGTFYEDGETPESDTDHTVMLGLIACAYAKEKAPQLDNGKIAQFALIHDLVEVYAGDVETLIPLSSEAKEQKRQREQKALERIEKEFGTSLPWIPRTVREYESLATPEARFVKTMDKAMPSITHLFNNARYIRNIGLNAVALRAARAEHRKERLSTYASNQPEALALYDELAARIYKILD